jgi:hypothetical protein
MNKAKSFYKSKRHLFEYVGNIKFTRLVSSHQESKFARVTLHFLAKTCLRRDEIVGESRDKVFFKSLQSLLVSKQKFS